MKIHLRKINKSSGDTLVEVLLSTVVLSIVLAGAYTLSNRATRINQQAYERTKVSNYLQEQAEYLRALRDTDTGNDPTSPWQDIINNHVNGAASGVACSSTPAGSINTLASGNDFHLAENGGGIQVVDTPTKYKIEENLFYIWIEGVSTGASSYVDFVINACWEGIGTVENQQTGIVIRLEKLT